jgi:hypothetical protein
MLNTVFEMTARFTAEEHGVHRCTRCRHQQQRNPGNCPKCTGETVFVTPEQVRAENDRAERVYRAAMGKEEPATAFARRFDEERANDISSHEQDERDYAAMIARFDVDKVPMPNPPLFSCSGKPVVIDDETYEPGTVGALIADLSTMPRHAKVFALDTSSGVNYPLSGCREDKARGNETGPACEEPVGSVIVYVYAD